MPTWPSLFPLYLHYKRDAPYPRGPGDSDLKYENQFIVYEQAPGDAHSRNMYYK